MGSKGASSRVLLARVRCDPRAPAALPALPQSSLPGQRQRSLHPCLIQSVRASPQPRVQRLR
eukprot:10451016-Lingulodinium_polyedra.AAC.1